MANKLTKSLRILKRDKRFAPLIKKYGPPDFRRPSMKPGDMFQSLCRAIVYQQISGKAASSILSRFKALFPKKEFPSAKDILAAPDSRLRSAGLSGQKVRYIKDLAEKFSDGSIRHRRLHAMESAEIIEHLQQVKGVGEWTAHMVLIFTLRRPDILPTGDLGVRKGFQALYGLKALPTRSEMEKLSREWREHASVASWYLWRVADEKKR